jgi:hypothetical protein
LNTSPSISGGNARIAGGLDAERGADEAEDLLARKAAGPPPGPAGKPPVPDSAALPVEWGSRGLVKHPHKFVGNLTAVLYRQHAGPYAGAGKARRQDGAEA